MRKLIYILMMVLSCSGAVASEDFVAFIGEAISATRSDRSCEEFLPKKDKDVICMDRVFELKYEVKESLMGRKIGSSISFVGFYHYWGLPDYTMWKDALIILKKERSGYVLQRMARVDAAYDSWGVCEEWAEGSDGCAKHTSVSGYLESFKKEMHPTAGASPSADD